MSSAKLFVRARALGLSPAYRATGPTSTSMTGRIGSSSEDGSTGNNLGPACATSSEWMASSRGAWRSMMAVTTPRRSPK